ncbi:Os08g0152800 [Oryza sativa Japonica Group]|uniref:Os08g0152800 protein n=2 Tax=Oryza TaxID=4527 RepID=C7J5I7_ORYSJ|nr:Os08g0152800 [Oryza sativa Japonica Group]|eukprot:NP_001175384.1 Os08g0152800 [Oryza sativa Japonica Group]
MWNLWKLLLFLRWMCHHYCAMLMSLISLTWEIKGQPDCSRKQVCNFFSFHYILYIMNVHNLYTYSQRGVELFLCWAIMQGFAMMLQNRYQRQRLYTRIALGKVTYFSDQKTN